MFRKFSKDDITSQTALKSSVQRGIRSKLIDQMSSDKHGDIGDVLELLWPKKEAMSLIKCKDHISLFAVQGVPIFFQHFDGPYLPTLQTLHKIPYLLPRVRVDRGAIRFVISGANIMAPGLTSAGGDISEPTATETAVAVYAEGKEHAIAVGLTKMSTDDMKKINKGLAVELMTYLGDDLYLTQTW